MADGTREGSGGGDGMPVLSLGDSGLTLAAPHLSLNFEISANALENPLTDVIPSAPAVSALLNIQPSTRGGANFTVSDSTVEVIEVPSRLKNPFDSSQIAISLPAPVISHTVQSSTPHTASSGLVSQARTAMGSGGCIPAPLHQSHSSKTLIKAHANCEIHENPAEEHLLVADVNRLGKEDDSAKHASVNISTSSPNSITSDQQHSKPSSSEVNDSFESAPESEAQQQNSSDLNLRPRGEKRYLDEFELDLDLDSSKEGHSDDEKSMHDKHPKKRKKRKLSAEEKKRLLESAGFKQIPCDKCDKTFLSQKAFDSHSHGKLVFLCSKCQEPFSSKAELGKHKRSAHKSPSSVSRYSNFKCSVCNKTFPSNSSLRNHNNIHLPVKPFLCKVCGRGFSQRPNLERHEKAAHSEERSFQCCQCGKAFYDKYSLKQHESVHAKQNSFQCGTCGKCFKGSQHLRHHEKLHLAQRPFKCPICGKGFYQTSALKRHARTHTGEKPFQCTVCHRCFNDSSCLKNHMYMHSNKKPYTCRLCGKPFIKLGRLKKHESSHYQDGVSDLPPPTKVESSGATSEEGMGDAGMMPTGDVPVWDTEKETFANGAPLMFAEAPVVPITQSRDVPPRLSDQSEKLQFVSAEMPTSSLEQFVYPNMDDTLSYINTNPAQVTLVDQHQQPVCPSEAAASYFSTKPLERAFMLQGVFTQADMPAASSSIVLNIFQQAQDAPVQTNDVILQQQPLLLEQQEQQLLLQQQQQQLQQHQQQSQQHLQLHESPTKESVISKPPIAHDQQLRQNHGTEVGNEGNANVTDDLAESGKVCEAFTDNGDDHHDDVDDNAEEVIEFREEISELSTCVHCMKVFSCPKDLQAHQEFCECKVKSPDKTSYQCPKCPKSFTAARLLCKHLAVHQEEDLNAAASTKLHVEKTSISTKRISAKHSCPKCDLSFERKAQLVAHDKERHRERLFSCEKCGQTFGQRINLQRHQSSVHGGEETHTCTECGKEWYDKYALKAHMVHHRKEKNFQCNTCGKLFKGTQHLRHHEKSHLDEGSRPFVCKTCNKSFYQASALKRHERTHSGEKPFKCNFCGKDFSDGTSFKNHKYTHTQKPFSCDTCGKTFIKHSRYKRHIDSEQCKVQDSSQATVQVNNSQRGLISGQDFLAERTVHYPTRDLVNMVAMPLPTTHVQPAQSAVVDVLLPEPQQQQQQQPQQHLFSTMAGMNARPEIRNTALVGSRGDSGEYLWQVEGLSGDQRILVQPVLGQGLMPATNL